VVLSVVGVSAKIIMLDSTPAIYAAAWLNPVVANDSRRAVKYAEAG